MKALLLLTSGSVLLFGACSNQAIEGFEDGLSYAGDLREMMGTADYEIPSYTTLVWSDEFDYVGLPDSNKWDYERGFVRNNEKQYYTYKRPENAYVENDVLKIAAIKETYPNEFYVPGSPNWRHSDSLAQYTSASIISKYAPGGAWDHGYIKIRAKLPNGLGVWPALWTLGKNIDAVGWPQCGEIDIMEYFGRDTTKTSGGVHYAHPGTGLHTTFSNSKVVSAPWDDFHIYTVQWDSTLMRLAYDGIVFFNFDMNQAGTGSANPFTKLQYLLMNFALGGTAGGVIDDSIFPQTFEIDYVRVYQ